MTQHTQPITAESIFYKLFEPQPMIVEGLISKGLTILGGSPKIGKSWLALDLAISVANGSPFLGKSVQKTGVLYYCLEDTYLRVRNRMHELVDEPPDNLYVSTSSERIGSGFTRDIVSFLRDHRDIDLIIVDTLQKIRGADDGSGSGSYSKDYDEISKLKEIADLNNKSIIAIHHLRQKPDLNDPFNEITGTNGITGVSDTNIVLKRREGSTTAEMYVRGRDVEERKLILEFADLRWHMLEEKSAAEIEKEKIPEVLYKVADFNRILRPEIKPPAETQVFFAEERLRLIDYAFEQYRKKRDKTQRYTPLAIAFLLYASLRRGEIVALRFEDIRGNQIVLHDSYSRGSKELNGRLKDARGYRTVVAVPQTLEIIEMIRKDRIKEGLPVDGFIFTVDERFDSLYSALGKMINKYCEELGIPVRSLHKTRKTCASMMHAQGVDDLIIQEQLSHKDIQTTYNCYCYDMSSEEARYAAITKAMS